MWTGHLRHGNPFNPFFRLIGNGKEEIERGIARFQFAVAYARERLKTNKSKNVSLKDIEALDEFSSLLLKRFEGAIKFVSDQEPTKKKRSRS